MSADGDTVREKVAIVRQGLYEAARGGAREGVVLAPVPGYPVGDAHLALDEIDAALARLEAAEERASVGPVPTEQGGPNKECDYWMRQKLQASIRHLRDIEDFFRFRSGVPGSLNEVRADRARQLYEAIAEDFVNGKVTRPARGDLEAQRDALAEALRRTLHNAERLLGMTPQEVWRAQGGDDGQGHYEGDHWAEQVAKQLRDARAALAEIGDS